MKRESEAEWFDQQMLEMQEILMRIITDSLYRNEIEYANQAGAD